MKFLKAFHTTLVALFAALNGAMIYLFILQLPYGIDPFLLSLRHWDKLGPRAGVAASVGSILAVTAIMLCRKLPDEIKNRLLYMRWHFPHPASNAFLTTRKQPFESRELLEAFPAVKDAGFSRRVQTETWEAVHRRQADVPVVVNTRIHWEILRDLYLLSLLFLGGFLLAWLANPGISFNIVSAYVFLFGAQNLFLLLTARRIGFKLVDNALAVELGIEEDKGGLGKPPADKRKR